MYPMTSDSKQLPRTGLRLSALAAFVSALWLASPSAYAAPTPADARCYGCLSVPEEPPANDPDTDGGGPVGSVAPEDTTTPRLSFAFATDGTGEGGSGEDDPLGPSHTIALILGAAGLLGGLFHFLRDRSAGGAPRTSESPTARAAKVALSGLQGLVGVLAAFLLLVLTRSPVPECAGAHAPIDMLLLFGLGLLGATGSKCLLGGMACNGQNPEAARNAEPRANDVAELDEELARLGRASASGASMSLEDAVVEAIRSNRFIRRTLEGIANDEGVKSVLRRMNGDIADVERALENLVREGRVRKHEPDALHEQYRYSLVNEGGVHGRPR